ncbi:Rieske 2Fe-2S domain-containing protein [Halomonas sp. YLGW01]|uniref:Rieske (2Fe-2S) protein n=1 Tax=Halomonas sp. YLGW01 TaxID=2773308 RepID=UPI0017845C0B|nr:Rieske 2Fe-2S domain-containing protein [Halomonas sp. YLGW01]
MPGSPLARLGDLDATGALAITLPDGRAGFLVRVHGHLHGYENRCPHRDSRLEIEAHRFLAEGGELIQCAHHGALFLPENGECVAGPCQYQSLEPLSLTIDDHGGIHLASE